MFRWRRTSNVLDELRREFGKSGRLVVSGRNLEGIRFGRRALIGLEFRHCVLTHVDFTQADLSLAQFIDCNLYRADFTGAVLYTTRFYGCNLTKAVFTGSYLLGFRLGNSDLTKTYFDLTPAVGVERKSHKSVGPGILEVPVLGELPAPAPALEATYSGIRMAGFTWTVVFLRDGDSADRKRIRLAETARYLKIAHAENGYERQAMVRI